MSGGDIAATRTEFPAIRLRPDQVLTGWPPAGWWHDPLNACLLCGMEADHRLQWGFWGQRTALVCDWCIEWFAVHDLLHPDEARADWRVLPKAHT